MVFNAYARYYDLLYRDKDYTAEVEYLASHLREKAPNAKQILELGCGTGIHATQLVEKGFTVDGVDISSEMLGRAQQRKDTLCADAASRLSFGLGDVRSIRMKKPYDVVVSLFHVVNYQSSNRALRETFQTVASHLEPGGIFLFDSWYGPAVLTQMPEVRVKRLEDECIRVTRIAEPSLLPNDNIVEVEYQVWIEDKESGNIDQFRETHTMRYLFIPELEMMLGDAGMRIVVGQEWMTGDPLDKSTWSAAFVAEKL